MGILQNVLILGKLLYPSETVHRYLFSFQELLCSTSVLFFINIALKERSMTKAYGYTQYQAGFSNSQDELKSKNLRRPRTN